MSPDRDNRQTSLLEFPWDELRRVVWRVIFTWMLVSGTTACHRENPRSSPRLRADRHATMVVEAGHSASQPTSIEAPPPGFTVGILKAALDFNATCLIRDDHALACAGLAASSVVRSGWEITADWHVWAVRRLVGRYRDVSIGQSSACAVGLDDRVTCWGIGLGGVQNPFVERVIDTVPMIRHLAVGAGAVCVSDGSSVARCFRVCPQAVYRISEPLRGNGDDWRIRYPSFCNGNAIRQYRIDLPAPVQELVAGDGEMRALSGGGIYRWPWDLSSSSPERLAGASRWRTISPHGGIDIAGRAYCCGIGSAAARRNNQQDRLPSRFFVETSDAEVIATSGTHACVLTRDRRLHCWGGNQHGEVRAGEARYLASPIEISDVGSVSGVYVALGRTCAYTVVGTLMCWGGRGRGMEPLFDQDLLSPVDYLHIVPREIAVTLMHW